MAALRLLAEQGLDEPTRALPQCILLPGTRHPAVAAPGERAATEAHSHAISRNNLRSGAGEHRSPHVCLSNGGRNSLAKTVAQTARGLRNYRPRRAPENLPICFDGADVA